MNQNSPKKPAPSALILASGLSERMGKPKALLKWDRSVTFLEKLIGEFVSAGCEPVVCTVNHLIMPHVSRLSVPPNVIFVLNGQPELGRMYSVRLGLQQLEDSSYCFIHNADNPFIHENVIREIAASADPGAWCSPVCNGKSGHPVLIPKTIINHLTRDENPDTALHDLLRRFPKIEVPMEDDCILKNINTPGDYQDHLGSSPPSG